MLELKRLEEGLVGLCEIIQRDATEAILKIVKERGWKILEKTPSGKSTTYCVKMRPHQMCAHDFPKEMDKIFWVCVEKRRKECVEWVVNAFRGLDFEESEVKTLYGGEGICSVKLISGNAIPNNEMGDQFQIEMKLSVTQAHG